MIQDDIISSDKDFCDHLFTKIRFKKKYLNFQVHLKVQYKITYNEKQHKNEFFEMFQVEDFTGLLPTFFFTFKKRECRSTYFILLYNYI